MSVSVLILKNLAGIDPGRLSSIQTALLGQNNLESVIRWGEAQNSSRRITEIITQDEFTHDVVLPFDEGIYLVYDTT